MMKRTFLIAATALSLSAGVAFAAGTDVPGTSATLAYQPPVAAVSPYATYYSGYVFPNEFGDQPTARAVPQSPHGVFSRVYLYPPSEGSDAGNGAG
jgi:hypothetical protein